MKMVMDKRLGQAEIERRRLEQLVSSRSSSFHGSTVSLDSNSDDSGESPTPKSETSGDTPLPTGEKIVFSGTACKLIMIMIMIMIMI